MAKPAVASTSEKAPSVKCGSDSGESSASCALSIEEDLSDHAYQLRHAELEKSERARFFAPIPSAAAIAKKSGAGDAPAKTPLKSKDVRPCPTPPRALTLVRSTTQPLSPAPAGTTPKETTLSTSNSPDYLAAEAQRWADIPEFDDRLFPLTDDEARAIAEMPPPPAMTYELPDEEGLFEENFQHSFNTHSAEEHSGQPARGGGGGKGSAKLEVSPPLNGTVKTFFMSSFAEENRTPGEDNPPPLKIVLKLPVF